MIRLIGTGVVLLMAGVFATTTAVGTAPRETAQTVRPTPQPTAPGGLTFEIDEATLTGRLNRTLTGQSLGETPLGQASAKDLVVHLQDEQLVVSGTAQVGRLPAPVELTATATVQAGRVLVHLAQAQFGQLQVPGSVTRQLEQRLQDQVDQALAQYGLVAHSVRIRPGRLAVVGTRRSS